MSYKLCKECGQPMLKKGQRRKHPDDYRHAKGCPLDLPLTQTNHSPLARALAGTFEKHPTKAKE